MDEFSKDNLPGDDDLPGGDSPNGDGVGRAQSELGERDVNDGSVGRRADADDDFSARDDAPVESEERVRLERAAQLGRKALLGGGHSGIDRVAVETKRHRRGKIFVNSAGAVCLFSALAVIVAFIGWPISEADGMWLRAGTYCAAGAFLLQEILRFIFRRDSFFRRFAEHWFESLLSFFALVMFFAAVPAQSKLSEWFAETPEFTLRRIYATVLCGLISWVIVSRVFRFRKSFFKKMTFNPGRAFILSFVGLILLGTLFLKMPNASVHGISWCDALFLSTSSACVTGLAPFDIAVELTRTGHCVVLVLTQLGGLGVMLITYILAYFFSGGISLRSLFDFRNLFSEDNIGQIGMALAIVIVFTIGAEALGAVAIAFATAGTPIVQDKAVFFAVFQSVSAFCNSGFSCVPGAMANPELRENAAMISAVSTMVLIGGLGFPVVKNFWMFFVDGIRVRAWRRNYRHIPVRLSVHTKIVLTTTAGLLVFGAVAFFFLQGDWSFEGMTRAAFLSATSRTAGFDLGPTSEIAPGAKLLLMALMFIGGNPFSTAGGIKTTTFVVALLSLRQVLRRRRDLEVFGRRINSDFANYALAILLLAAVTVFGVTVSLSLLHPEIDILSLSFETVSALGTVGLSCEVTPQLGDPAKYLLAFTMLVGRAGFALIIMSLMPKERNKAKARLPETTIVFA